MVQINNDCEKCGGTTIFDLIDKEFACIICGWRKAHAPNEQEKLQKIRNDFKREQAYNKSYYRENRERILEQKRRQQYGNK